MKRKPNGYIGQCQCGEIVGAVDLDRMERKDLGKLLGLWIFNGYTLIPQFDSCWSAQVTSCKCEE